MRRCSRAAAAAAAAGARSYGLVLLVCFAQHARAGALACEMQQCEARSNRNATTPLLVLRLRHGSCAAALRGIHDVSGRKFGGSPGLKKAGLT
jgi:hypothetical protein